MGLDARGRLVNVRELKARIAVEATRQGVELPLSAKARDATHRRAAFVSTQLPPFKLQPDLHPRPDGYSMADYGAVNDEAFVVAAYMSVLGRPPDPVGLRQSLAAVRRGTPKALVLARLRFSREGRAVGARVRGLVPRALFHLMQRVPVLGWLANLCVAVLAPARVSQRQDRLESLIAQLAEELAWQSGERLHMLNSDHARLAAEVDQLWNAKDSSEDADGAAEIAVVSGAPADVDALFATVDRATAPWVAFTHDVVTCRALEVLLGRGDTLPARRAELFRSLLGQRGFARSDLLDLGDRGLLVLARR